LDAGFGNKKLLTALSGGSAAAARHLIKWQFPEEIEPAVYMHGRGVRIEAAWPDELATKAVRLSSVGRFPDKDGRWVVGMNEYGQTVVAPLSDTTPHWLLAGTTGSGKTVSLTGAAYQLSRQRSGDELANHLVVIDGKGGADLTPLRNIPGQVGPFATDVPSAREALGWAHRELLRRQALKGTGANIDALSRIVILFDEFHEFTGDALISELMHAILARGRAVRVHMLLATHHPTVDTFGDESASKRLVPGRLALKVLDFEASKVAIGDKHPRADRLIPPGDAYAIGQGARAVHRTQCVLVDHRELDKVDRMPPQLERWPSFRAEDIGQAPTVNYAYTGAELAHGLAGAMQGWGRGKLQDALDAAGIGSPGSERADRLKNLTRDQLDALRAGVMVPASDGAFSHACFELMEVREADDASHNDGVTDGEFVELDEPEPVPESDYPYPGQVVRIGYD